MAQCVLRYRGRDVSPEDVAFIRELIAQNPALSRRRLSAKLCQAWNWVQPNGALRDMICRGLLLALHLETFIDPQRFRGTCYHAANWRYLGRSTGRGHRAWSHRPNRSFKELWVYPLSRHFRQHLLGSDAPARPA